MKPVSFMPRKAASYLKHDLGVFSGYGKIVRLKIFVRNGEVNISGAQVVVFDQNSLEPLLVSASNHNGECEFTALSADRVLMITCRHKNSDFRAQAYNNVRAV